MEPIIVSHSELDTFRQCPLKHQLAYKERWTKPLETGDRRHLGTVFHQVMETHYNLLKTGQVTTQEIPGLVRAQLRALEHSDTDVDTIDLVEWMYDGYLDQWGFDPAWKVLEVEYRFQVPLRRSDGNRTNYHIKGFVDLVVEDLATGGVWIIDHKSGRNLPSMMDLELDDQFGIYVWAMRELGYEVMGAVHNAVRTQRNTADHPGYQGKLKPQTLEQRFARTYLNRSDQELDQLALDAYNAAYNAYPPKSRQMPLYSSPDPRQCGWKCDFKEAHIAMRKGIEPATAMTDFGFEQNYNRH